MEKTCVFCNKTLTTGEVDGICQNCKKGFEKHHYKIVYKLYIVFDDGTQEELPIPEKVYYYREQKYQYWASWVREFMAKRPNYQKNPVRVIEVNEVIHTEPYSIVIGL